MQEATEKIETPSKPKSISQDASPGAGEAKGEVKWVDVPCSTTKMFEGKKLLDLGHYKNPAMMQRGDMALLIYVLSPEECLLEVTNEVNPIEGWYYRGPFTSWASSPEKAVANLGIDDAFTWQFQKLVDGSALRSNLRLKIDLNRCSLEDEELQRKQQRFLYIGFVQNEPVRAMRAYVIALRMHTHDKRGMKGVGMGTGRRKGMKDLEAFLMAMSE